MARIDVRRLAAVDMYGARGALRRRQIIRAEFIVGVVGGISLGTLALLGSSVVTQVLGAWLIGVGINYVPLAAYAMSLCAPGRLEAELAGLDIRAEQRYYTRAQLQLFVPLLVAALAVAQRGHEQPH